MKDTVASTREEKLDRLDHVRMAALFLQDRLVGTDVEAVRGAQKQFEQLADMFYNDFQEDILPRQYETARTDYEYFMVLLESTRQHYLSLKDGK